MATLTRDDDGESAAANVDPADSLRWHGNLVAVVGSLACVTACWLLASAQCDATSVRSISAVLVGTVGVGAGGAGLALPSARVRNLVAVVIGTIIAMVTLVVIAHLRAGLCVLTTA